MAKNIVEKTKERYLEYERRHFEILEQAIRLFNARGYNGATTAELAKAAGISEPTMYKHFKNKKALFQACFRSITDELFSSYRKLYRANPDDEVAYLKGIIKTYVDFVENNPHKSMFLVHLLSYKNNPEFEDDFNEIMQTSIETIENVLASAKKKGTLVSDVDVRFLAAMFVSHYFQVIAVKDFIPPEMFTMENFFETIRTSFIID